MFGSNPVIFYKKKQIFDNFFDILLIVFITNWYSFKIRNTSECLHRWFDCMNMKYVAKLLHVKLLSVIFMILFYHIILIVNENYCSFKFGKLFLKNYDFPIVNFPFLAHLTQRVMWGIAITWCPSVNFSYFNLLLWNNWTKWNQTWQKASI